MLCKIRLTTTVFLLFLVIFSFDGVATTTPSGIKLSGPQENIENHVWSGPYAVQLIDQSGNPVSAAYDTPVSLDFTGDLGQAGIYSFESFPIQVQIKQISIPKGKTTGHFFVRVGTRNQDLRLQAESQYGADELILSLAASFPVFHRSPNLARELISADFVRSGTRLYAAYTVPPTEDFPEARAHIARHDSAGRLEQIISFSPAANPKIAADIGGHLSILYQTGESGRFGLNTYDAQGGLLLATKIDIDDPQVNNVTLIPTNLAYGFFGNELYAMLRFSNDFGPGTLTVKLDSTGQVIWTNIFSYYSSTFYGLETSGKVTSLYSWGHTNPGPGLFATCFRRDGATGSILESYFVNFGTYPNYLPTISLGWKEYGPYFYWLILNKKTGQKRLLKYDRFQREAVLTQSQIPGSSRAVGDYQLALSGERILITASDREHPDSFIVAEYDLNDLQQIYQKDYSGDPQRFNIRLNRLVVGSDAKFLLFGHVQGDTGFTGHQSNGSDVTNGVILRL